MKIETVCPYPVEEKITAEAIETICEELGIPIITSAKEFSIDLNLNYEGYNQHKKIYSSKRNPHHTTQKQAQDKLDEISSAAKQLILKIQNACHYKEDNLVKLRLESSIYLSNKRGEIKADSISDAINMLNALVNEADHKVVKEAGVPFNCSSRQWFLAIAIPKIYKKNTGEKYSRSFNSDTLRKGKPHKFLMKILRYFDDFKKIDDSGLDSAIANYNTALKRNKNKELREYTWPYEWTKYKKKS